MFNFRTSSWPARGPSNNEKHQPEKIRASNFEEAFRMARWSPADFSRTIWRLDDRDRIVETWSFAMKKVPQARILRSYLSKKYLNDYYKIVEQTRYTDLHEPDFEISLLWRDHNVGIRNCKILQLGNGILAHFSPDECFSHSVTLTDKPFQMKNVWEWIEDRMARPWNVTYDVIIGKLVFHFANSSDATELKLLFGT